MIRIEDPAPPTVPPHRKAPGASGSAAFRQWIEDNTAEGGEGAGGGAAVARRGRPGAASDPAAEPAAPPVDSEGARGDGPVMAPRASDPGPLAPSVAAAVRAVMEADGARTQAENRLAATGRALSGPEAAAGADAVAFVPRFGPSAGHAMSLVPGTLAVDGPPGGAEPTEAGHSVQLTPGGPSPMPAPNTSMVVGETVAEWTAAALPDGSPGVESMPRTRGVAGPVGQALAGDTARIGAGPDVRADATAGPRGWGEPTLLPKHSVAVPGSGPAGHAGGVQATGSGDAAGRGPASTGAAVGAQPSVILFPDGHAAAPGAAGEDGRDAASRDPSGRAGPPGTVAAAVRTSGAGPARPLSLGRTGPAFVAADVAGLRGAGPAGEVVPPDGPRNGIASGAQSVTQIMAAQGPVASMMPAPDARIASRMVADGDGRDTERAESGRSGPRPAGAGAAAGVTGGQLVAGQGPGASVSGAWRVAEADGLGPWPGAVPGEDATRRDIALGPEASGRTMPGAASAAQTAPAAPRPPAAQVAASIAAAPSGAGSVEVTLSPEELGRVTLTFQRGDGGLGVVVFADRDETMTLLRRHADELRAAMEDFGLGGADIAFGGESGTGRDETAPRSPDAAGAGPRAARESRAAPLTPHPSSPRAADGGRLDLRI